jgi:hypothetical protein
VPTNHFANSNNGNAVKKAATTTTTLNGRTSGLAIYTVNLSELAKVIGTKLSIVISSMRLDNDKDLQKGYRQPTDHDDRDGNLPVAPGNGVSYREYFVPSNQLPKPAYLRLVADMQNGRLFITPTHYDVWSQDRDAAKKLDEDTKIADTATGAQNPFFLINTNA